MNRNSVPMNGHRVVHVPARDVVAHRGVDPLDRSLDLVGTRLHPAGHEQHRADGQQRGDEQVEDRLVDVERPELDPRVELELVLRRELVVVEPRPPEDPDDDDQRPEVEAEDDQEDLLPGAHGRSAFLSSGWRIRVVARWTV
jgi:hypothetical protein